MQYGKFNSAEELLKGYVELEKTFTQKCQQVANLQKQIDGTSATASPSTDREEPNVVTIPQGQALDNVATPTNEWLQQYLLDNPELVQKLLQQDVSKPTAPTVMTGGGTVSLALPSRPKTIREATLMAKSLFDGV